MTNFKDIYEGYVIHETETGTFIGPNADYYRVARRCDAVRFTRKDALEYIESGHFIEPDKTYTIQDAT